MDLIIYYSLFLALFVLLSLKQITRTKRSPKLPPGPWQLPLIGSLHHMLGSELPHRRFCNLSKTFGPLMHLKLGELSMVVASSPEAAMEIMKTHDKNFATRPLFDSANIITYDGKGITFAPYGEYWRQVRKILLTKSREKVERCHRNSDRIIDDIFQQHREKRRRRQLHEDEEEEEGEDLVDVLLRLQEDESLQFELTDDSIKAIVTDMFGAGTETSSTIIQWAMAELMRNPNVMKKAQSEVREAFKGKLNVTEAYMNQGKLNYLYLVIKETLRLHAPIPLLLPRECRKKCEVLGYEIPEKTRVLVNAWAIGRDPQYWEDAEEFKPERFEGSEVDLKGLNFEFLPFGAGRRVCPGILFGLPSVEFALAQLLYYFDWKLAYCVRPESLDMSESFGITARRRLDLCLHATPFVPRPIA